ncbi:MAG: hypothetical protein BWY82_02427 [Verrucomicrobia bacterium ADurb.Bin474]|nr:MAG: hypothetical protein BWY82_02427 [Verrucomicrobia bacterium ADurb.Bin474]
MNTNPMTQNATKTAGPAKNPLPAIGQTSRITDPANHAINIAGTLMMARNAKAASPFIAIKLATIGATVNLESGISRISMPLR